MSNWRQWNSHRQRWGTALLMAAPVLVVLTIGPYWSWFLLVGLLAAVGLWEYQNIVFQKGLPAGWQAFYISTGLAIPAGAWIAGPDGLHGALFIIFFAAFFALLITSPQDVNGISRLARFVMGWLYIPYLLSYVLLIGRISTGNRWVFFALLVTIANDAGAFYCGKYYGRHKLYERVSPKKTIEGSAGGLAGGMLLGTSFGLLFLGTVPMFWLVFLSLLLAVTGQIGDLLESLLKRLHGIKDSSDILPGHGGILDRLDSLLFVFPVIWFFVNWINYC